MPSSVQLDVIMPVIYVNTRLGGWVLEEARLGLNSALGWGYLSWSWGWAWHYDIIAGYSEFLLREQLYKHPCVCFCLCVYHRFFRSHWSVITNNDQSQSTLNSQNVCVCVCLDFEMCVSVSRPWRNPGFSQISFSGSIRFFRILYKV